MSKKSKIDCSLCKTTTSHMIITLKKDGDIHVHGPFENPYLISSFVDAIIREQKKYNITHEEKK